jgi:hypothetical protein
VDRAGLVERGSGQSEVSNYEKVSGRIYRRNSTGVYSAAKHYALSLFLSPVVANKTNTKKENPYV